MDLKEYRNHSDAGEEAEMLVTESEYLQQKTSKIHKASIQFTISSLKHTNVTFVRDCVTFNC